MSAQFIKAAEDIKNMTKKPNDVELLDIYALYKQATIGDCNTERPGMLDFKGKAKWDAWNAKKGVVKSEAEESYITLAGELLVQYKQNIFHLVIDDRIAVSDYPELFYPRLLQIYDRTMFAISMCC